MPNSILDLSYASGIFNPLNAELNPICHLLALLGGATIVVVSRLRVKSKRQTKFQGVALNLHHI